MNIEWEKEPTGQAFEVSDNEMHDDATYKTSVFAGMFNGEPLFYDRSASLYYRKWKYIRRTRK